MSIEQHKDKAPLVKDDVSNPHNDWFDNLEQELDRLLLEKAGIEEKIADLRSRIMQQMTELHLDKYSSSKYSISYSPAKTVLQFDRKTFKAENEALYSSYCIPKQKEASIVIRKNRKELDE